MHDDSPQNEPSQRRRPVTSAGEPTEELHASFADRQMAVRLPAPPSASAKSIASALFLMLVIFGLFVFYTFNERSMLLDFQIIAKRAMTIDYSASIIWLNLAAWASFFAFWRRYYSLLVLGCILGGIGLGEAVSQMGLLMGTDAIVAMFGGLAAGFLAIYLLGRTLFRIRSIWALYPAFFLVLLGAGLLTTTMSIMAAIWLIWIPCIIVGTGLYLGFVRKQPPPTEE